MSAAVHRAGEQADDPRAWVGRSETTAGALAPDMAAMLAGALAHPAAPEPAIHTGAPLPWLWHWAAFPDRVALSGLGEDGHPKRGGFLPPLTGLRRMWAGGRLRFKGRFAVGERLRRDSTILSIDVKEGGRVPLIFVRIGHEITGEGAAAIHEEQDLVYLPVPDAFHPPRPIPTPEAPVCAEPVEMSEIRLFRYSAATWNAHRIHYDLAYTTEVEHYPGLVVHGPMQATLLIEAGARHAGRAPARFRYRAVHPLFAGAPVRLMAVPDGDRALDLCTAAEAGHQGMQARLEWEETT